MLVKVVRSAVRSEKEMVRRDEEKEREECSGMERGDKGKSRGREVNTCGSDIMLACV